MLSVVRARLSDPPSRRIAGLATVVLALSFVPLAGTLGYENGLVLAPLVSLIAVGVGVDAVGRARRAGGGSARAVLVSAARDLATMLGVALAVLVAALLWQTNCDPGGGLVFFAMGPVCSGICGAVAGMLAALVAQRRRRALALGIGAVVASTAIGAWRLIADPVVFAFDPFWGYFSGAIYDEDVAVREVYVAFRAYNLVGVAAALQVFALAYDPQTGGSLSRAALRERVARALGRTVAAVVTAVLAIGIGVTGPRWGFTANVDTITAVLSGTRETEHFVIHYHPRGAEARNIDAVAMEHELAWSMLRRKMDGREPPGKVHSFVFTDRGQKRALMGAGTVQVAAPWRNQIYLDHRPFPHPVLHHELAHVFGRTIGDDLFGVARSGLHLNIALIEGFATAMAPRSADHLDLHDQALVLERLGRRPSLPSIMGPSFFTQSSRVAYTAAGSFCLWLMETRGFAPMAELYRSAGDFEAAYDAPLTELETQWLAFLEDRGGVTEDDVENQRQKFMRRSVFRRPCAHRAANLHSEIAQADRRGDWEETIALYQTLCSIEPEDPAHPIGLAWAHALGGDFPAALEALATAEAMADLTVSMRSALLSRKAEVALAAGELEEAAVAEREALELPISRGERRTHQLRLVGAEDPALAPYVVDYLAPFDPYAKGKTGAVTRLMAAVDIRDQPGYAALGSYLMARQLLNVQQAKPAVALLQAALDPTEGDHGLPSPEFERAALEALLSASIQAGELDVARGAVDRLASLPGSGHGDAADVAEWRERIEFFAASAG